MKRILHILLSAAALAGCAKSDVLDRSNSGRIVFESFVAKPDSKAVPVDQFTDGSTMSVWGYSSATPIDISHASAGIPADAAPISELAPAAAKRIAGSWSYSPAGFWTPNHYHCFTALSPTTANAAYNNGIVTYTNPVDVAQQQDFMVAEAVYTQAPHTSNAAKISFTLRHALSLVRFSGAVTNAGGMTNIRITQLKMLSSGGFISSGTLNIATQAGVNPVWSSRGTAAADPYTITPTTPVTLSVASVPTTYDPIVHGTHDILMVIPQTASTPIRFELSLVYEDRGETKSQTAKFEAAAIAWKSNYVYSYKFGIDMNKVLGSYIVSFEPSIDPWGTENDLFPTN